MQSFFATMFEDVRVERWLYLLLSVTDPDLLKQSKFTDHEMNIIKNLASEILYRQIVTKEYFAVHLLE